MAMISVGFSVNIDSHPFTEYIQYSRNVLFSGPVFFRDNPFGVFNATQKSIYAIETYQPAEKDDVPPKKY